MDYDYHCSGGHDVSAPHPLTECVVWKCQGTLTERRRPGPKKKSKKEEAEHAS
jgi:hypothetical protein